jgi:DNA-binding response OmpR family regulator
MTSIRRRRLDTGSHPRVVLIEDDFDTATMYRLGLEMSGCEVLSAPDGASGLTLIASEAAVSVVVLDLTLPRMDGLKVLSELSRRGSTREIPVIVLSNRVQDFAAALSLGATQCMEKSKTSPAELLAHIGETAHVFRRGA